MLGVVPVPGLLCRRRRFAHLRRTERLDRVRDVLVGYPEYPTVRQPRCRRARLGYRGRPGAWRSANAGVDIEVDDSKPSADYANGVRLDPRADSRDSRCTHTPHSWSQGDAIVPDAVCLRPDAAPRSEEDERRVLGRSRAGYPFHAHGHDRRADDDASKATAWRAGMRGRHAERHQHERRDQQCASSDHVLLSVLYAANASSNHKRCPAAQPLRLSTANAPSESGAAALSRRCVKTRKRIGAHPDGHSAWGAQSWGALATRR